MLKAYQLYYIQNQTSKNKLHFIKRDVMESLTKSTPNEISILRLDTDWYASSKFELEQLYKNGKTGFFEGHYKPNVIDL